jgi:serine/threonine-protein kinase
MAAWPAAPTRGRSPKVLDSQFANHPEIVARLYGEHQLASRVKHPGLVEIRAARMSTDEVPYLVMEYLEGETLGAIADRGPIDTHLIITICAQVAAALTALHSPSSFDVKHDNVFILHDEHGPRVKLIDFGVSRLASEPPDEDAAIAGTPWCMAPEQWQGQPSTASDVYALGCLLYDLTTGRPPFDGSLPELMNAHLEQRPARPSWLAKSPMPIELERIILRALAKHPDQRPAMAALATELAELADAMAPVALLAAG